MVNRASLESREVLQQLWKANVSDVAIDLALQGTYLEPAPEAEPATETVMEAA
jgi:hypothetical protein